MPRLKDRNRQTPGGHKFYDPVLKYRARPWASIDEIAMGLMRARQGNPALTQQHGWSTDIGVVTNEVDETIARHCKQMGWHDYIVEDPPPGGVPNFQTPATGPQRLRLAGKLRNVVAGLELNVEWLGSGEAAVPIQHAEKRATICANCPENGKGGLLDYFTVPAAAAINKALEKRLKMKLSTSRDDELKTCKVCLCPLKLKVFSPIDLILKKMPEQVMFALPGHCWILLESAKS